MRQDEVKPLIIREWNQWAGDDKDKLRVLEFFYYLKREEPYLLEFRCAGSKYQCIKCWLINYSEN